MEVSFIVTLSLFCYFLLVQVMTGATEVFPSAAAPLGFCELDKTGIVVRRLGSSLSIQCDCYAYTPLHGASLLSHPPTFDRNGEPWPNSNDNTVTVSPSYWSEQKAHVFRLLDDSWLDKKDSGRFCCSATNASAGCFILVVHQIHLRVNVDFCEGGNTVKPCCVVRTSDPYVRNNSVFLLRVNGARSLADFDETKKWYENHADGQTTKSQYFKRQSFKQKIKRGDNITCELQDPRRKVSRVFQPVPTTHLNFTNATVCPTLIDTTLSDFPVTQAEDLDTLEATLNSEDTTMTYGRGKYDEKLTIEPDITTSTTIAAKEGASGTDRKTKIVGASIGSTIGLIFVIALVLGVRKCLKSHSTMSSLPSHSPETKNGNPPSATSPRGDQTAVVPIASGITHYLSQQIDGLHEHIDQQVDSRRQRNHEPQSTTDCHVEGRN